MNKLLKVALCSAAAAGAALLGWHFVRAPSSPRHGTPQPPEEHDSSSNGDFEAEGRGVAGELTEEQRERLLEELEDQLNA